VAKSTHLRARYGANILESMTDDAPAPADRAPLKLRPATVDRLEGTGRLKGAMMLPVARVTPDPDQPRREFDAQGLDRLAASIRTRGVLSPIRVRWDEPRNAWVIVAGERRYRASLLLGLDQVPAIEASHATPDEVLADQLVENCVRQDLTPVEQARAIRRLLDQTGNTQAWVSDQLGISRGQVSKVLSLLETPPEVQARVESGELASAAAVELKRVEPSTAVEIARGGGDIRTVRRAVEEAGGATGATKRTSRYEDRFDDVSVTVVVRRPGVTQEEFASAIESALTRCRSVIG
jgi:ParB family transcriptional regulator, chromosome partitioning protein